MSLRGYDRMFTYSDRTSHTIHSLHDIGVKIELKIYVYAFNTSGFEYFIPVEQMMLDRSSLTSCNRSTLN